MNPSTALRLKPSFCSESFGRVTRATLAVVLLSLIPESFAETYVNRVGPVGAVLDVTLSDAT